MAPQDSIAAITVGILCGERLSITTKSPGRRLGASTRLAYCGNTLASVAPSITIAAVAPSSRTDDSSVVVAQ